VEAPTSPSLAGVAATVVLLYLSVIYMRRWQDTRQGQCSFNDKLTNGRVVEHTRFLRGIPLRCSKSVSSSCRATKVDRLEYK
jgi:hypothetical protein